MTKSEVLRTFEDVNCAPIGDGFAPHKPIVILLLLEMIVNGHENGFAYREFDPSLRRLLQRYGSPSAADARNQPFCRLKNDGILEVTAPYSLLLESARMPTPAQLMDYDAVATMPDGLYQSLRLSPELVAEAAKLVAAKFLRKNVRRAIVTEAAPSIAAAVRTYWWVSQNQNYREEIDGDFMWFPQTNSDLSRNPYSDFMREIAPGDVVFSFSDSQIKAIGIVRRAAVGSPNPATFFGRGNQWRDEGWLVEVAFRELVSATIRPSEHMALIAPTLPSRYSPIRPDGLGTEMYFAPVPHDMANVILALVGKEGNAILENVITVLLSEQASPLEDAALEQIHERTDIGATQKEQMILARRGQGLFRTVVHQIEQRCRITRVENKVHLVASHIKPWATSSDEERLSPFNGLLLSPHVDHLFDRGYLSFHNSGEILVSKRLDESILRKWHLDSAMNVGSFREEQCAFLEYHRDAVLIR